MKWLIEGRARCASYFSRKGRCTMAADVPVDAAALREEVRSKYREVAIDPHGKYHFHTGRPLAARLGYDIGSA